MKLHSNKCNYSINLFTWTWLPKQVSYSMSFTGLMCFQFRLSVWKLFVPILREYCTFFLFGNSLENAQNILISFPSSHSHLYLSFHASWYLHVFLVKAGVSDPVLISLWYDDCLPPKKEYSEPCTCFHFNILWLMFYFTKGKYIRTIKTKSCHLLSHGAFCFKQNPDFYFARECLGLFACLFLKRLPLAILFCFKALAPFGMIQKTTKKNMYIMYFSESDNLIRLED